MHGHEPDGWPQVWVCPGSSIWAAWRPPGARQSDPDHVLSRVRHPSFPPEQVPALLGELSRRRLRRLWRETTLALDEPLDESAHVNLVVLRAHLLDRLDPAS